jgi:hypothetical protein
MKQPTKNPWVVAGAIAGLSVAGALALLWPSASRQADKIHALAPTQPEQKDACRACQEARCELVLDAVYPPPGGKPVTWPPADAGGPPSPEKRAAASKTYECFRRTHCGDLDPGVCYCGDSLEADKCFAGDGKPSGSCRDAIEQSADTKDAKAIGLRYSDPGFALGLANSLRQCDLAFCKAACK